MVAIALTAIVVVAVIAFMVWGDDGPMWKNWLTQAGVIAAIVAIGGVIVWVAEYGS